jgi:hypothetical protein
MVSTSKVGYASWSMLDASLPVASGVFTVREVKRP